MLPVAVDTEPAFTWDRPELLLDTRGYGTPDTVGTNRRFDISPDGKQFLMFNQSATADAVPDPILVQCLFDELQRLVPTP